MSVGGRKVMCRFEHVNVQLTAYEAEKIGGTDGRPHTLSSHLTFSGCAVDALINSIPDDDEKLDAPATVQTELENLEISLSNLLQNIGSVKQYVQAVVVLSPPSGGLQQFMSVSLTGWPNQRG